MSQRIADLGSWIPSRRTLVMLVGIIVLVGVVTGALESGLAGEPIAAYNHENLDVAAVDELARRGIEPCPVVGPPVVPDDLSPRLDITCEPYDTQAGAGPVIAAVGALGAVIVVTSGNRFGLYLLWVSMVLVVGSGFGAVYQVRGILLRPGSLPAAELVAFVTSPSWIVVGVLLVPRMVLIFPTGRLPSPRWRWITRGTYVAATVLIISSWLSPLWGHDIRNPLPIEWSPTLAFGVFDAGILLWMLLVSAAFAGLLWRFVIARGEERQQLKWVAYAIALALIVNLTGALAPGIVAAMFGTAQGTVQQIANFVILPTAALISIFKYRLYDIDRIINRTVVYGLVTLVVGAVFVAVIILAQTLLLGTQDLGARVVTIIAVATLVVATAFNPLRRRVQRALDRRFNRSHYDAQQVVAQLQERLQEPSELNRLVDDVSGVIGRTLMPTHLGVWTPEPRR